MRHPLPFAALVLLLAAPAAARAEGTGGCHCFRDRTFDPERPSAADPYILATARSSLLSAVFGPGKSVLVRKVMSGTAAEALWVAYWAAARSGADPEELLSRRERTGSWTRALAGVAGLGKDLDAALAREAPEEELARLAVENALV